MLIPFLFLDGNICCGYSLEALAKALLMSTHNIIIIMFSLRNKKNIMWIPPLICSYGDSHDQIVLTDFCTTGSNCRPVHKTSENGGANLRLFEKGGANAKKLSISGSK